MTRRVRLDAELVRRKLARSREHASELIGAGHVFVGGQAASKPATQVQTDQPITVRDNDGSHWVSRGAHKLLGALAAFEPDGLSVAGRRCLDAGASTGGFTEVLLSRQASEVLAVDVGYGQLAWSLRSDARVRVFDRTNVRELTTDTLGGAVDVVVSDLSFISLTVVLPALSEVCTQGGDMVLMVKPQFEVGRSNLGKNGVVRDAALHVGAVLQVCEAAFQLGWGTRAVAASPLPGPAGNVEYFGWLRTDAGRPDQSAIETAVATGPLSGATKQGDA
jgi:23S rRNA (cytidine1920-2'-O)/16S rRNA (cytidine1409-2'-O)-methyltransferase